MTASPPGLLGGFIAALASGSIRVIDLTQTLSSSFPTIELAPQFGQARAFELEEISRYDERGPQWYWNNFCCSEHTGTHFDAPIHWITGRDLPNNAVDTVAVQDFIAPACVIDCSEQAAANPDYLMTVADIERHEQQHGRIPAGWWALMRTDWSKRTDPQAFVNRDHTGQHTPGPSEAAVRMLVHERNVLGFGTESIGTDAGLASGFNPPLPCHSLVHGAGRHGLQCLMNLDQLPARGAVIVCPPLKIINGSGSPVRVLALVEAATAG